MKISVIVPTYKPQKYLRECLDSLCQQSLAKDAFEVIVVLNGDKEPYNRDILSYIHNHTDLNIQYIQTDVRGVSHARNLALDVATGEYIAFIDDDDYVSPNYLEELLAKASLETVSLAYPVAFQDGSNEQVGYILNEEYLRWSKYGKQYYLQPRKYFSGPCMKLLHRDIVGDRRFDTRFANGEDSLFMFLLSDKMKWVDFTSQEAVYYRRIRENSAYTRRKTFKEECINCWKMFKVYTKYYFSDIRNYSFRRYTIAVLGLLHTIIDRLFASKCFTLH